MKPITSSTLSLFAPAKINLFLHITGKRRDGYHNLQTVFRLLQWGDKLQFKLTNHHFDSTQPLSHANLPIRLDCAVPLTADILDNLVLKAADALLQHARSQLPKQLPVINVTLHKTLPTGAGLGGGSSNAATTLIALNQLWQLNLDNQTLMMIGARVGADVPIFLYAQDAIAEGIGEQLTPIYLPKQHYLLLTPQAHASTQQLFTHPNLCRNIKKIDLTTIANTQDDYLYRLNSPYHNVFEPFVTSLIPEVKEALDYLKQLEPITQSTARMTGTGSSVFLPIPSNKLSTIKQHVQNSKTLPCHAIIVPSLGKA